MAYKIYGEGGRAKLNITVDGYEVFGCTLAGVAEESREWLAQHLDEAFQRASARAAARAVNAHKDAVLTLLGAPVVHRNY